MTSNVKLDLDFSRFKRASHEGLTMMECYESLAEHLPKVRAMEVREDDVILRSYPKSGTHWLFRVIDMILRGSTEYYGRTGDSTFLDVQRIEMLPLLDSPRVLLTHLPWDLGTPDQAKVKRTKTVHVYRNPKAVMVSLFFMLKNASPLPAAGEEFALDSLLENFFDSEKSIYKGWWTYMDSVTEYIKEYPDQPVFNISYEEMTLNPMDTVKRLAEFLGKDRTPEFCAQVVEACSFKKQKETEESMDKTQAAIPFYRKGDMNDWKNYVTVAASEKFDKALQERADRCPFSAQYIYHQPDDN